MSRVSRDQKRKEKLAERERRWLLKQQADHEGLLKAMTAIVTDFANQMGCEAPRPLELKPESCFQTAVPHANVLLKVHLHGGRAAWGWHFSLDTANPGQYRVDAEFHAVWESPNGDLIDITPQPEQFMADWEADLLMPLPFFCEDKRYFQKCTVEDLGNGVLYFRTVQKVFPPHEYGSLMLPTSLAG